MYSIGASPYNSRGTSLYGGFCDPGARGGAMMGGFAPGANTGDWLQLLQTQKFLSLKRRFNGLTEMEAARRKLVNKIIMRGTLEKNRELKMARMIAAQKGNFGYVPPTNKVRHYWHQLGVDRLEAAKRHAWDLISQPNVTTGEQLSEILRDYETAKQNLYDAQPLNPPDKPVEWGKAFAPDEYDPTGQLFSGYVPSYSTMSLDANVAAEARRIRKERRIKALEAWFRGRGWGPLAAQQEAVRQANAEEAADVPPPPPPLPEELNDAIANIPAGKAPRQRSSAAARSASVAPRGRGKRRGELERLNELENSML